MSKSTSDAQQWRCVWLTHLAPYDLERVASGHHEGAHQKLAPSWLLAYVPLALTQTGMCVIQTMFVASAKTISTACVVLAATPAIHVH